jgi:uncharacterized protein
MGAYTYPGVYIEEISSGQHTITGVATSIAAFVGWSNQGPVGTATMVESWAEYSLLFGGLIPGNLLGYAVYQFFGNGGSQAYIVRLVDTTAATASSVIGGLQLYANNPGAWANGVSVQVYNVTPNSTSTDLTFNLKVTNTSTKQVLESYTNLSVLSTSPNFAVTTINNDSNYISFTAPASTTVPTFLPFYLVAGAVAAGPAFDSGETVKQASTNATATLLGLNAAGDMLLGPISGAVADSTDTWTGQTSNAKFTPTAAPAVVVLAAGPTALNAGTGSTTGADGNVLVPNTGPFETALLAATGYQVLANVPIFNLLCVPGENNSAAVTSGASNLLKFCHDNRAFLILDAAQNASKTTLENQGPTDSGGTAYSTLYPSYGAFYYPWISAPDPQAGFRPALFPPCGYVAGAFAATDADRGVWKAPAGIGANLSGALGLQTVLNDGDNGLLNPMAVNCLRQFRTYGNVIWGARTLDGADAAGSQWKYVPIRRLAMYIESSLYEGTQWVVFEPNDEPLWGQVRLSIGTFLQELFLRGAFAGTTPQQAYFVKCDSDNNPDFSIAQGIVNITVGFAPLYPAEFVVIQITQMTNS